MCASLGLGVFIFVAVFRPGGRRSSSSESSSSRRSGGGGSGSGGRSRRASVFVSSFLDVALFLAAVLALVLQPAAAAAAAAEITSFPPPPQPAAEVPRRERRGRRPRDLAARDRLGRGLAEPRGLGAGGNCGPLAEVGEEMLGWCADAREAERRPRSGSRWNLERCER